MEKNYEMLIKVIQIDESVGLRVCQIDTPQ